MTMPLSKTQLKRFLNETRLAHIATASIDGKPRVNPIWFVYENGSFYFTTRMGRLKGRHIQQNSHVALSVASDKRPYRAVCAFGTALLLRDGRDEWLRKIGFRYGKREGKPWLLEALKQPDRVVIAVKPDQLLSWDYSQGDAERQGRGVSMVTKG
jgi:PPOX class probable F420-dependent enzyme